MFMALLKPTKNIAIKWKKSTPSVKYDHFATFFLNFLGS